jgi:hypothetical protein
MIDDVTFVPDNDVLRKKFQNVHATFVDEIGSSGVNVSSVVDHLYSKKILSRGDKTEIEESNMAPTQCRVMLKKLEQRPTHRTSYRVLHEAVRKLVCYDHIIDQWENSSVEGKF